MVGSGQNQEESIGSQCQDQFLNLERRRDQEFSVHTTHTGGSQSQGGSHPSHEENTRSMQLEIAHLRKSLRRRTTPSSYGPSFDDDSDISYRPRSRTPPSKFFSCDKDHLYCINYLLNCLSDDLYDYCKDPIWFLSPKGKMI